MKKIVLSAITAILCIAFAGCSVPAGSETATAESTARATAESTARATAESTARATAEPTAEPTETPVPTPDQTGKELLKEEDFYFYDKEGNVVNSLGSSISNGDFLFMDDSLVEYTSKGIKLGDSLEQVEEAYRDVGGLYEYTIEEEGKVPRISYKSGDKILRMDFENGELKNCFISTERNDKIGIFLSGCENYYQRDIGGDVTINDEFQKHSKWMKMLTQEEIEVRNKIADHADTLKYEDYTQWTTTNGMISVIYKDHNPYSWLTAAECETLKGMYQKFENNYEFEY